MKNDFGLPEKTTNELLNYFKSKPEIEKVLIFGSRAKGNYRTGSDVDFALWKAQNLSISTISFELDELPTPYKFDVIDYNSLAHEGMKNSIDKDEKVFYLRKHAKMKQYGKEIKGKPSETPIDSLTLNSTKSIFSDILKYLISDCDNQTLMSGNPEKAVKAYLKDNSERLYNFSIPKGDYAQEFIEFAQHFSKEVLGKNIFKIVIK